jgi:hypothetical protein
MPPKTVKIPNKRDARNRLARHLVSHLQASEYAQLLDCTPQDVHRLTAAEDDRFGEEIESMIARLQRLVNDG